MKPKPFVELNHLTVPVDISPSINKMPRRGCATGQNGEFGWDRVKLGRAEQQADPRSVDPRNMGTAADNVNACRRRSVHGAPALEAPEVGLGEPHRHVRLIVVVAATDDLAMGIEPGERGAVA